MFPMISPHFYCVIDLIQIETIGDAYCVAGGLHKKVESHAKPIAHMALKMMELSEEVLTPDGKPIKVNFHSAFAVPVFTVTTFVGESIEYHIWTLLIDS